MARRLSAGALAVIALSICAGCGSRAPTSQSYGNATISCIGITGSIIFTPPLTKAGSPKELVGVDLISKSCTSPDSVHSPAETASTHATIVGGTGTCTGILISHRVNATISWTPRSIPQTILSFGGYRLSSDPQKDEGIVLLGRAIASGSFVGSDKGASSKVSIFSDKTVNQILATCESSTGLRSLPITVGSLTLG